MTVSPETPQPILTGAHRGTSSPGATRKAVGSPQRDARPGPAQVAGSVRGSHAAELPPALTGEQWQLRQILQGLTRDPKVHRFESFGETVVYESQRMARLVALPAFGQQLSQSSR
jgi:hypothetical protein